MDNKQIQKKSLKDKIKMLMNKNRNTILAPTS